MFEGRKKRKKIFEEEYQKAKKKALQEAKLRSEKQIREAAQQKAQKFNITKLEKYQKRKQQIKSYAKKMKQGSKNISKGSGGVGYNLMDMDFGFSNTPTKTVKHRTTKKHKKSKGKKKKTRRQSSNSFFSADNNFGLFG